MNITFALDESLVSAAKATAARHGTSISALVRTALEQQVAVDTEIAEGGASGVMQALLDYSMGRVPRIVTMQTLGIEDYAVLMCLLNAAHLPHPVVPLARRKAMAAGMVSAVRALDRST
jgi:plasmid stability protein